MESGCWRSLDIRNTYPRLDPDPRRNLPTSSQVLVRRVVVQSGPGRVGIHSGDNYSAGRYPDVPPSAIKPGSSSWLDEEDGDGLENSPIEVESCGKDSCSMGSGG